MDRHDHRCWAACPGAVSLASDGGVMQIVMDVRSAEDFFRLKIGESVALPESNVYATRVPGGWLYTDKDGRAWGCFAPLPGDGEDAI